jgi:hypothetical protein
MGFSWPAWFRLIFVLELLTFTGTEMAAGISKSERWKKRCGLETVT